MRPPPVKTLFLVAALLQIVWGAVPSASLLVIREIPVELYISLRWTISGLIFLTWLGLTGRLAGLFKMPAIPIGLLGIAGYGLASFGTLYGLKIGGVTNFALMGALNPIVTSAVAILVLREKPASLFYVALPLCVSGLLLLVLGKHRLSSWDVAIASSALIIGAAALEALVFVFSRRLKRHFDAIQYLAVAQLSAAAFMWLLELGFFRQTASLSDLSVRGWSAAIFVSVIACVLCYSVLYWLLNFLDGHRLALFDGLHTVSAALFGFMFFNEAINGLMLGGGALLICGLVLGNLPGKKKTSPERP